MLGYATTPADLALGRVTTELRTGDLAQQRDGLFEVVGRRSRRGKVFGLRIDLDASRPTCARRSTDVPGSSPPSPASPRWGGAPEPPSAPPSSSWRSSAGPGRGRPRPVLGGLLLMLWVPHVPVPAPLARAAGVLAGASLFIHLTHWQVYPPLEDAGHQWLALVASLTVGIAYARVVRPVHQAVGRAVLGAR